MHYDMKYLSIKDALNKVSITFLKNEAFDWITSYDERTILFSHFQLKCLLLWKYYYDLDVFD